MRPKVSKLFFSHFFPLDHITYKTEGIGFGWVELILLTFKDPPPASD